MPDLTVLRDDLAAFAAEVGHPLTAAQARALALDVRTTVVVSHRQAGKSRGAAVAAVHWAFRRPRQTVLVVSAGEDAARRLLALVRAVVAHPLLAGAVVDESGGRVTLSNGSSIVATPASERAIRGLTVDLLVIDEAGLVADDVGLGAALPTTAARPDARVLMLGTPWAGSGFFFEHAKAGDGAYQRVHHWTLADSPWVSGAVVEAARLSMSPARFAAEYEGVWGDGGGALFGRRLLERCVADVELPEWGPLPPCRPIAGLDYGAVHDLSVLAWWARVPVAALNADAPELPVYVAAARAWPRETPLSDVAQDVARTPSAWAAITSEANGLGVGPTQELARLLLKRAPALGGGPRRPRVVVVDEDPSAPKAAYGSPVPGRQMVAAPRPADALPATVLWRLHTSAETKALGYERLRWLMERGQVVLPRDEALLRELAAVRVELSPSGGQRIEGPPGGHDDRPDALVAALGIWRDRRRRLRCTLAEHAERATPEAEVPPLVERVVVRGDGLRVYARPPLQSIAGRAVSLPEGARVRRAPPDPELQEAARMVRAALDEHDEQEAVT